MTIELITASSFSIQELTELYNQTRVDYLVPMPINAERLQRYVDDFDIDLVRSFVARDSGGQVLGLGMLGVRKYLAWITRLGVLPVTRRSGAGGMLMDHMLAEADELDIGETHLEVIQSNHPAHNLFVKKGFRDVDTYLVMRRAPQSIADPLFGRVEWLDKEQALQRLHSYYWHLTWITAFESMLNAPDTQGMRIKFPNGNTGWLVYRLQKFSISHLIMHTEQGDAVEIGTQLLRHLYTRYPRHDTYAENIHDQDPHLPVFKALSFFHNFSRIEMRRLAANNHQE